MKTIKSIMCCVVLLAMHGVALAAVEYYEDFESLVAASWPCDAGIGLDPNAMEVPWSIVTDPNNGVVVINNTVPGAFEGSNYLRMERVGRSSLNMVGYGGMASVIEFELPISSVVSVSFAFMHPNGELGVSLWNSNSDSGITAVDLCFGPTGYISNIYYGIAESIGLKYARDEWNQVRIDANFNTYTYDVYLNGIKANNMAFSYPETSFDRISFVHNSKAMPAIVYLDAIKIETGTTECITPMRADMSGDCKVDMKDFVEFASSWLMSNLYPED